MKGWVKLLIFTSVWAQIFLMSASSLFAQKIPVWYKPPKNTARNIGAAATTRIPYVVNPRLPVATQQRVAAFSGTVVDRNISNRVVEAAHQVTNHTPANPVSVNMRPVTTPLKTGLQALQTWRPGWRSELQLAGFTEAQLNAVEQTFIDTDEFLFELDEDGTWLSPAEGSTEWEYRSRFSQILTSGTVPFTEGHLKVLFGKFSRLDEVFTHLEEQGFVLVHKRMPKTNAPGAEGTLARKVRYNIAKRDGNKMNPEVEEYVYGNREVVVAQTAPARLSTPAPSYGPKGRTPRRTPDEVLEQVLQFIRDNGRFPAETAADPAERLLRRAFNNACLKAEAQNLKDGTSQRLLALKAQWVKKVSKGRTPQEVLTELEVFIEKYHRYPSAYTEDPAEESLRNAADGAIMRAKDPQDPTIVRLTNLKAQWVRDIKRPKQLLTELEVFIEKYHRYPSQTAGDPAERSLRNSVDDAIKRAKDPQDPTIVRLIYLKTQWVKEISKSKTPQEVLTELETFIERYHRYPFWNTEEQLERSLYNAVNNAIRRAKNPEDPVIVRLTSLKEQWEKKGRTPQEVLTELENFIEKYHRYPSREAEDPAEESLRDAADGAIMRAKDPQDPIIARLVALKAQWVREKADPRTSQEILEQVQQYRATHNGQNPSAYATDKEEKSLRFAWNYIYYKYKNVPLEDIEDLAARELVQLHRETISVQD